MIIDLMAVLTWALLVAFGSVVRTILGIYKAYDTYPDFRIEWKRISVELIASTFFGGFGFYFLQGLGVFNFGLELAAPVAGLLGADAVRLLTRKIGLKKDLEVIVSTQQMKNADLNDRQVRAMGYLKQEGKITNKVYQKINSVGRDVAKYELNSLVSKGRLAKFGSTKDSYYTGVGNLSGENRVVIGVPKNHARKIHQKLPNRNMAVVKPRFEAQKRVLQQDGENN